MDDGREWVVDEMFRDVLDQARKQGHARGLPRRSELPATGGSYSLTKEQRANGVKRTLYFQFPDGKSVRLGWYLEGETTAPAPPAVNGTGPKKASGRLAPPPAAPERAAPEPVASEEAEPLILLTPAGGGAWRLNGYGVARAELIRALRLSLVHLVARQSGVAIIDEVVAPEMAVVTTARLPRLPQPRSDKAPGKRPAAGGRVKRTKSYPLTWDELDDEEDGSDQGELLRQDAW